MAKAVKNSKSSDDGKRSGRAAGASSKAPARRPRAAVRKASAAKGKGAAKAEKKGGVGKFLRDVRVEMGKVTWPSRKDLVQSTIVVLVAVFIAAAYVGALDFAFSRVIDVLVKG